MMKYSLILLYITPVETIIICETKLGKLVRPKERTFTKFSCDIGLFMVRNLEFGQKTYVDQGLQHCFLRSAKLSVGPTCMVCTLLLGELSSSGVS